MWVSAHVKCVTNKSRDQTNTKVGDTLMVKRGGGHVLVVQQSKDTETLVPSETKRVFQFVDHRNMVREGS